MINKWIIHTILTCQEETCGLKWEDYRTAVKLARKHSAETGHKVLGEIGYGVEIK